MNRLIVLGAGLYQVETIRALKGAGFFVVALDRDAEAPGFQHADESAAIDIRDKNAVLKCAAEFRVDGIMPINDFGTRSAFYACQKLGLTGPSYLTGVCGNDKGLMRDVWAHESLPQPIYRVFGLDTPLNQITACVPFPMVVKPVDCGGGGRGISVARSPGDLLEAIAHATPFVDRNRLIAEEFVIGTEVTVESLVHKGVIHVLAISDKVKPESRYRVATSLNYPAALPDEVIDRIIETVTGAIEALGVTDGAAHTELIVSEDYEKIWLIETGIRGGGGHVFGAIIKEVTGISAPIQLARILCGLEPDLTPKKRSGCVYRFFNPCGRGVLKSIRYDPAVVEAPAVVAFDITCRPGQVFDGLTDSMKRVGYVVTRGADRDEAIRNADIVESNIIFDFQTS